MNENNQNPLTKTDLAEFTDAVLLPAMVRIFEENLDPVKDKLNSFGIELAEIKVTLERIDKRTDEDTTVAYREIEKLKIRISFIEEQMKILKAHGA